MIDFSMMRLKENEIRLFFLCTIVKPVKSNLKKIEHLSNQKIDWDYFEKITLENRVAPLIYKNLKGFHQNVPGPFIARLKQLAVVAERRSFFYIVFLQKLLKVFKEKKIFVIPFKGPVLAEFLYGSIALRYFSDLDILIDRSDAFRAFHLIKKTGLVDILGLTDRQFKNYIKAEDHLRFSNLNSSVIVELHWEMSGLYLARPLTINNIKNRIRTGQCCKFEVSILSDEDLLVYLCIHGTKHGWNHFEQICSVAELLKMKKNLNWGLVSELSSAWECRRIVHLGLLLAFELLDAPVPGRIIARIKKDSIVTGMGSEVLENIFLMPSEKPISSITGRFASFHIRIRDSFKDKLQYILRLVFRPTEKEWRYFPLPARLSFLHYFFRPYRLTIRKIQKKNA